MYRTLPEAIARTSATSAPSWPTRRTIIWVAICFNAAVWYGLIRIIPPLF